MPTLWLQLQNSKKSFCFCLHKQMRYNMLINELWNLWLACYSQLDRASEKNIFSKHFEKHHFQRGQQTVESLPWPTNMNLSFDVNSEAIRTKRQQMLCFLRRLNVFNVDRKLIFIHTEHVGAPVLKPPKRLRTHGGGRSKNKLMNRTASLASLVTPTGV